MSLSIQRIISGSQLTTAAATYYTAAAGEKMKISMMSLTNSAATAVTATVYLVPSGGTAGVTNLILSARSIPASGGEPYIVRSALGQTIPAGGTIQALASVAASITIVASGTLEN